jgi:iron complex outermembrane receptor protein
MKKITGIAISCFLFTQVCVAQFVIRGKVLDEMQQPLSSVTVTAEKKLYTTVTDSAGNYSFPFPDTSTRLSFSHIGYETRVIDIKGEIVSPVILFKSSFLLSEMIVNSFERNSSIKNIAAAVTVLNKDALERYNNESFVAAVNTVPGVKMDERSPGSYRLSIRGNLLRSTFGVRNVKVYWNGIPFTDANGNTYFNELALTNVEKVEILKGPSGSMYGAGTGGVVLLRSNLNQLKEKSVSLQTTAGSYGLFTASASYDQSGQNSQSSLSFSHQQSNGYRAQTNMRRDVANFSGTWLINPKQDISANIFYSDLYYQTPGALTKAEMISNPRQARPKAGVFESAETQQAALYLKTFYGGFANEYRFNNRWTNNTSIYFSGTNFKNPTIRNYERKTEQGLGARSLLKYQRHKFTGTFGAEYQYGFTNTSTFGNKAGSIDTLQIHDEIDSRQFNVFLQSDFNLVKDFILQAGISYNNFHYGFTRLNQLPSVKQSSDFTPQFVPRVSLLKKIKDKVSVYFSLSKGYSPPSIDEVHAGDGNFNRGLNAETAMNYEIGFKGDILKNKLVADISYYLFGLKNTIVSRRDASGGDYFVNAGKTKQRGLEASLRYTALNSKDFFIRQLVIWSNYTNIHARFVDYEQGSLKLDGNRLTGTAPNIFVIGTDLLTAQGLYANLTYSYTDKIPLDDANNFYSSAYNLFFGKVGYKLNLGRSLQTDLFISYNKSLNEPYSLGNDLNAAGNRFYNPAAPQNFSAGIKLKMNL